MAAGLKSLLRDLRNAARCVNVSSSNGQKPKTGGHSDKTKRKLATFTIKWSLNPISSSEHVITGLTLEK